MAGPNRCLSPALAAASLLAMLASSTAVAQQSAAPRAVAAQVADTIAREYFDPAKGEQIASGVRSAASAGAFDHDTSPDALAAALTARLKPIDRHLRVRVTSDAQGQDAPPPPRGAGPVLRPRPRSPGGGDAGPGPRMREIPVDDDDAGIARVDVLDGNIGYLRLSHFADLDFDQPDAPARKAIDAALARLSNTSAVIIDVRGNHGGSPAMVGYLVSAFTPRDAAIYNRFRTRDGARSEAPQTWYAQPRTDVPLYVLVDDGTASAAESFAYTLQAAKRARIVGAVTAGAANPGEYFPAGDGYDVFVPTGSPLNPATGSNWEGTGVQPDVAVASAQALDSALGLARTQ